MTLSPSLVLLHFHMCLCHLIMVIFGTLPTKGICASETYTSNNSGSMPVLPEMCMKFVAAVFLLSPHFAFHCCFSMFFLSICAMHLYIGRKKKRFEFDFSWRTVQYSKFIEQSCIEIKRWLIIMMIGGCTDSGSIITMYHIRFDFWFIRFALPYHFPWALCNFIRKLIFNSHFFKCIAISLVNGFRFRCVDLWIFRDLYFCVSPFWPKNWVRTFPRVYSWLESVPWNDFQINK